MTKPRQRSTVTQAECKAAREGFEPCPMCKQYILALAGRQAVLDGIYNEALGAIPLKDAAEGDLVLIRIAATIRAADDTA